ncbi:nucleoside-diphosphate kinase [[Limnothrix rosea] IAM M-220]|uniref:nucleoside-diphosphate kinase n=1 Tax=[Limnothrix rosea] IAM M-220 TaxID=454133 RepID=UPI00096184FF|nr:nucleoside-diphosphate kinase [[Limnothrix rosea] IAM M-220]OKH17986.1 nucleoside-diphosphate kinase [[Limnothrix rosea] IAM M-220]
MERTFVMVKPDGVQRGLAGNVIARFEAKGFKLVGLKLVSVSKELAEEHYGVHKERPFFGSLVSFITSSPVVAMVWEGKNVISAARTLIGATNPIEAAPGTIRGDFGMDIGRNLIHGSDGADTAASEIALWFNEDELASWEPATTSWLYE